MPATDARGDSADAAWLDGEPAPVHFGVGRWSFDLADGSIDNIAWDGVPVLRALRFVVRDRDWRTVDSEVGVEVVSSEVGGELPDPAAESFLIKVRGRTDPAKSGIDLTWFGRVTVTGACLTFDVRAEARQAFQRNRIGLVVLHSAALSGHPLTVRHTDGQRSELRFPREISPHQPARDIAGLDWTTGGVKAELDLHGEVFEMEDQRNWTDASFKTYSTPLTEPFPVRVSAGAAIEQSVELRCRPVDTADQLLPDNRPTAEVLGGGHLFPGVGVAASTGPAAGLGGAASPGVVLVELDVASSQWRAALARAAVDASGGPLDVRLICEDPAQVDAGVAEAAGFDLVRLGVFDGTTHISEAPLWSALQAAVTRHNLDVALVGGTRAHFTELNRNIGRISQLDAGLSFSITPQMHDRSRQQVIESIAMQRLVAEQAVRLASGRAVHIGPVTLRPRFNAVATSAASRETALDIDNGYGAEFVADATDPRQSSLGAAAWLIASAAALAVRGVESLTFCEAWGLRGLRSADDPDGYPALVALHWLTQIVGWTIADPMDQAVGSPEVGVLVARHDREISVLASNLGASGAVEVTIGSPDVVGRLDRLGTAGSVSGVPHSAPGGIVNLPLGPAESVRWRTTLPAASAHRVGRQ